MKFDREKALATHLVSLLGLQIAAAHDPNAARKETGIDVAVSLANGLRIGIQVTEIDPYPTPGRARAEEKRIASAAGSKPYGGWVQNDPSVVLAAIKNSIERKVKIVAAHSFDMADEVWL